VSNRIKLRLRPSFMAGECCDSDSSASDESRIQAAGDAGIGRSLDDGAAVGE
jgi:hypothetical protein